MTTLFKIDIKKKNGVLFDSNNNLIKKFYLGNKNKNKNKQLINEFSGYQWYFQHLNKIKLYKKKFVVQKKFNSIVLPTLQGQQYKYWNRTIHRTDLIEKVINHYKFLWPQKKYVPYHGDLTIENIIFMKKKNVVFIDWENYSTKEEWGLDICYFLISMLILPVLNSKKKFIKRSELNLFKIQWEKIFKKKNYSYLNNPIKFIKKKCNNKNHFFFKITKGLATQINESIS